MRKWISIAVLACVVFALVPRDSGAVPAFARRWKVSCTTCHAPFPRLKEFGDEFAGNGFIIPEDDKERDYVKAGDDLLKLNKDFPIAGRFDAYAVWDDAKDVDTDLQTPYGLKLLSGGPLAPKVGYYFYFYMNERGEVAGVEDAIIHFDDVFGSGLDVAVGQFQTSDPLLKRELRLTYEDYLLYKSRPGFSTTDLTYDRGLMLSYGIESSGTDLVVTVTNGNGKGEADENHQFDSDDYKNVGVRLAQGVGERLSVGGYLYAGRDYPAYDDGLGHVRRTENDVLWWGPDMELDLGKVDVRAQYLLRTDSDPFALGDDAVDVDTKGLVAELVFAPGGDLGTHWFTLLYNRIEAEAAPASRPGASVPEYESFTASATYTMARNLKLIAEYTRNIGAESNRVAVGTVTAF